MKLIWKSCAIAAVAAALSLGVSGLAAAHDHGNDGRGRDRDHSTMFGSSGFFAGTDRRNYQHSTPHNSMGDRYHYEPEAHWDGTHWRR